MKPINNIYPYTILEKTEVKGFRYYLHNNIKLPSVTTILSNTGDKSGLDNWRKYVGEQKANDIVKYASGVGSRLHTNIENYIKGVPIKYGGTEVHLLLKDMTELLINRAFPSISEVLGYEITLYYPFLYAGTTDLVAMHNNELSICDYKNAKKIKSEKYMEDYYCQLAAYIISHDELYNTKIKKGVIFMVSREREYKEYILDGNKLQKYKDIWLNRVENYYEKFHK